MTELPAEQGQVGIEVHRLVRLVREVFEAFALERRELDDELGEPLLVDGLDLFVTNSRLGLVGSRPPRRRFTSVRARGRPKGRLDEESVGMVDRHVLICLAIEPRGKILVELGQCLALTSRIDGLS
jgi:hypothetical protein